MVQMSTVWDRTTAFASSALAAIMPIALVLLFVPVSIELAVAPLLGKRALSLVTMLFWAIELLGTLSLIVLALGATLRPAEAVRAALMRLGPTIGIYILLFVAAGVLTLPIVAVIDLSGADMAQLQAGNAAALGSLSAGGKWFLAIYTLALIVGGVWITARLLVLEPVILAERRGAGAIKRAFRLTRGLTLRIVGVLILYWIVTTIVVKAAQMVFGSIFALIAPDDGSIGIATVLTAVVVAAVSTAFKVIAAVFVAKLYMAIAEASGQAVEPV